MINPILLRAQLSNYHPKDIRRLGSKGCYTNPLSFPDSASQQP
nr:hypothetical protein [uncultured Cohaesibacter sp.]